jgi:hypothetical protein
MMDHGAKYCNYANCEVVMKLHKPLIIQSNEFTFRFRIIYELEMMNSSKYAKEKEFTPMNETINKCAITYT